MATKFVIAQFAEQNTVELYQDHEFLVQHRFTSYETKSCELIEPVKPMLNIENGRLQNDSANSDIELL